MSFLQAEKRRQTEWKLATGDLTRSAPRPGLFGNRLFPFCLPVDEAPQNLWFGIRDEILEYFQDNRIVWHTGALPGYPSNHLCSSQVFLVNFLAPFQSRRDLLLRLFLPVVPDLSSILPIETEDRFLSFEWVPPEDLLDEARSGPWGSGLTRGVGNTSIDFVFLGRTAAGSTILVMGEAKYTEHYPVQGVDLPRATNRLNRYAPLIQRCSWLPDLTGEQLRRLASEPVYQVLRPHPGMELLAMSPISFTEVSVQDLFRGVRDGLPADLADWSRYMAARYMAARYRL